MLILSRKLHQEIRLANGIVITVVAIRGKQVRLGIQAPADVPIRRSELQPLADPHPQRAARGVK